MKTLATVIVVICTLTFAAVGGFLIAFSLNLVTLQHISIFLQQTFRIQNIQLLVGGIGMFLIISSVITAQITLGKLQRERTIAFSNPEGQVSVSLSAMEDYVRRLGANISEIKDLRCRVFAKKRGIEISTRVSIWGDAKIPQTTENVQLIIKRRIQEMLGIEEPILVRVHVGKIVPKEKKYFKKKEKDEEPIPFQGNIEYGKD